MSFMICIPYPCSDWSDFVDNKLFLSISKRRSSGQEFFTYIVRYLRYIEIWIFTYGAFVFSAASMALSIRLEITDEISTGSIESSGSCSRRYSIFIFLLLQTAALYATAASIILFPVVWDIPMFIFSVCPIISSRICRAPLISFFSMRIFAFKR